MNKKTSLIYSKDNLRELLKEFIDKKLMILKMLNDGERPTSCQGQALLIHFSLDKIAYGTINSAYNFIPRLFSSQFL